jgi:endo-1,4-beta-xylanase
MAALLLVAASAGCGGDDGLGGGGVGGSSPFGGATAGGSLGNAGTFTVAGSSDGGKANPGSGGSPSGGGGVGTAGIASGGAGTSGGPGGGAGQGGSTTAGGGGAGGGGGSGNVMPGKKFVGNITSRGQVRSDFNKYWDQITPENEGKWGAVERQKDQMNWASVDTIYKFAKDHNIPFKQHNFVWGSQQPTWLNGMAQSEQRAQVEEWIKLFCQRYPDTQMIDVVNEPPPHTTPVYMEALGGAGASGWDWIVQAFKWAHQYCPNSILILNDYNNIENDNDNNHTIDIVKKILAAGAPINAVGAQSHAVANLSASKVQGYIDKIAMSTGLPVYISEFDINDANDAKQQSVMESHFTMFWNDDNVKGITIWGYIQGQTWEANSGLMSSDGKMRPAMTWLMQFLKR